MTEVLESQAGKGQLQGSRRPCFCLHLETVQTTGSERGEHVALLSGTQERTAGPEAACCLETGMGRRSAEGRDGAKHPGINSSEVCVLRI